jgi:hypothetical protein
MPDVYKFRRPGKKATRYGVSTNTYKELFEQCLLGERYLTDFLQSLEPTQRHVVELYIINRLAEVDPGYVPLEDNADTHNSSV